MRVVERSDLGSLVELLDGGLDSLRSDSLSQPQSLELVLRDIPLGELLQGLGEVGSLLSSDLSGRSVLGSGVVSDGKDSGSTQKLEVVVDGKSSSGGLDVGELGHEVPGDVSGGVSGSPNEKSVGDLLDLFVGVLDDDVLLVDLLNHGLGHEVDLVVGEGRLGVLDELLGEHGKDVGESLDEGDSESVGDLCGKGRRKGGKEIERSAFRRRVELSDRQLSKSSFRSTNQGTTS